MKDPFGLAKEAKPEKVNNPKRAYFTLIIVLSFLVVVVSALAIYFARNQVSANTAIEYSADIKISGLPESVNTGDEVLANLIVVNNSSADISNSYALIKASGMNLGQTVFLHAGLTPGKAGYVRSANLEDLAKFDNSKSGEGVYWYVGDLAAGESKSKQIKAIVSSGTDSNTRVDAKLFSIEDKVVGCGFWGLKRCKVGDAESLLSSNSFNISLENSSKIRLRKGYNFITLPYVFPSSSISDFFDSLKTKWAYHYSPTTAEYINLALDGNADAVKPGVGFWLYDYEGGEYQLPQTKVETNQNDSFSVNLDIGWNQIGNPYTKKITFSGDKITVQEISDDGSLSGTSYTLKSAIENNVLSDAYIISYKGTGTNTSNSLEYQKLELDSTLNAFTAFTIKSEKKVKLTFPGRSIISTGDLLSSEEIKNIETWIIENGLNHYGDPEGTVYAGGTPLFDQMTGQMSDRLDYIISQHPDRPWNR